jgi:hypothetical protein
MEKHQTEMKVAIAQMEKLERAEYKHYNELNINTYYSFNSFINSDFNWACDNCLNNKKAILASPNAQNYCWYPNYAYFDTTHTCRTCNIEFTFGKEEKKYWFENLKFWIDAEAVNCPKCRKEIRQFKTENTRLSKILKQREDDISVDALNEVIEIYIKWEKIERVKYYQAVLRKRSSRVK